MPEVIINNFSGGIADSSREQTNQKVDFVKHFDIYSDPKRLIPFPTIVANNDGITAATHQPANFTSNGSLMYVLARKGSGVNAFIKLFLNSGANSAWVAATNGEASTVLYLTGTNPVLSYYGTKIYGISSLGRIWAYDTVTETLTENGSYPSYDTSVVSTSLCAGIVGDSLGYLFLPYGNALYQNNGTAWSVANISLPTGTAIYGLSNYNSYLAILTGNYIYIWDFASISATEIIPLPLGGYTVMGRMENNLVLVGSRTFGNSVEITVLLYGGGTPQILWTKVFPSTVSLLPGIVRNFNNKVYFALNDTGTGRPNQGVWCVGRKKSGSPIAVSLAYDYIENGGTSANIVNFYINNTQSGANSPLGIYVVTDDFLIHKINGTTLATVNPVSYFETVKYKARSLGQLDAVSCSFAPLPTAGKVTVSYKIDADTSYTDIFTEETNNSLRYDAKKIELTTDGKAGARLPLEFKEIQFKIASLGGAEPTEFKFKWTEKPVEKYD